MKLVNSAAIPTLLAALLLRAPLASAIALGQVDDFEDGTTQNWLVGALGVPSPAPPVNIPDGGPLGIGDNYLLLSAIGGAGPGSRLTAINLAQWAGDYTSAGLLAIAMDLRNFGSTDLDIRLLLENPTIGPPTDIAFTTSTSLPAGGSWTHVQFMIDPLALTELTGDVNALLGNVTALRLYHSPLATFPGPPVLASLGVDNITALQAIAAPEPSTLGLLGLGLAGLLGWKRGEKS